MISYWSVGPPPTLKGRPSLPTCSSLLDVAAARGLRPHAAASFDQRVFGQARSRADDAQEVLTVSPPRAPAMAHLTLELLGYRLMESAGSLLNGTRWITQSFSRRLESGDAVLDVFVAGCVACALVVIAAAQLFLHGSKWLPRVWSLISRGKTRPPKDGVAPAAAAECAWINSFISWLYFHSDRVPRLVPYALRRLTEESSRMSDSHYIVFDDVLTGSLPPKILAVHSGTGSAEVLVVRALLELNDVIIAVRAVPSDGPATTGTWSFRETQAEAHLHFSLKDGVLLQASLAVPDAASLGAFKWDRSPEVQLPGPAWFDAHLRRLVSSVVLTVQPDYHPVTGTACVDNRVDPQLLLPLSFSNVLLGAGTDGSAAASAAEQDYGNVRQLRLKLLKATGLGAPQAAAAEHVPSWCCTIELDRPSQVRQSAAVQMQPNPSWSEEFVFDLDPSSKCLTFTVFDSTMTVIDEQPRRASLAIDDIISMRSSKPLSGGVPSRFVELHLAGLPATTAAAIGGTLFIEASPLAALSHSVGSCRPRGSSCNISREAPAPTAAASATANDSGTMGNFDSHGTPAREEPLVAAKLPLVLRSECTSEPLGSQHSTTVAVGEESAGDRPLTASQAATTAVGNVRNDSEILVVSPDMIVEVAKQKLAQQSRQPIVPGSRTTTIIVTSLQKTPVTEGGLATSATDEATEPSHQSGSMSFSRSSSRSSSTTSCCGSTAASSEGATGDHRGAPCASEPLEPGVLSAVSSKSNGKSKEHDDRSYSPQKMGAKSEQHLKPETPSGANGSFDGTPVSSSSTTDVRSKKHKLSIRKFFSFRKKPKAEGSDVSQSTPSKSKKN